MFFKYPALDAGWDLDTYKLILDYYLHKQGNRIFFEKQLIEEMKKKSGSKHILLTKSGSTAIFYSIKALGLNKTDEIIMPTYCCSCVISAIIEAGCKPVLADIRKDLNIDPNSINELITHNTKAIFVPHLCGKTADINAIKEIAEDNNLKIIEDAAQAVGGKYKNHSLGTLGDVGIFSFSIGKNIISFAGGALLTDSDEIFERLSRFDIPKSRSPSLLNVINFILKYNLRKYTYPFYGGFAYLNQYFLKQSMQLPFVEKTSISKIDSIIINEQLNKVDDIIKKRRENAEILTRLLGKNNTFEIPEFDGENNIYTKYPILLNNSSKRYKFIDFMHMNKIEPETFYIPLHMREPYKKVKKGNMNNSEQIWERTIILPINPIFTKKDMLNMAEKINKFI